MSLNFHDAALDFVRRHNCASSAPLELIEAAMQEGAIAAVDQAIVKMKHEVKLRQRPRPAA